MVASQPICGLTKALPSASGSLGILSYNITNNSISIYYDTRGIAQSMCVVGNKMYVADGYTAIVVLDLSLSWKDSLITSPEKLSTGAKKIPFGWNYLVFSIITIINLTFIVKKKIKNNI